MRKLIFYCSDRQECIKISIKKQLVKANSFPFQKELDLGSQRVGVDFGDTSLP